MDLLKPDYKPNTRQCTNFDICKIFCLKTYKLFPFKEVRKQNMELQVMLKRQQSRKTL